MPTGYTANIKDGISFNTFVLQCARAFGATITMRDAPDDTPIPERFEPSPWHLEKLDEAKKRLADLLTMPSTVAATKAGNEYLAELDAHTSRIAEKEALSAKYHAMLEGAKAWVPPTPDHEALKAFMIEQLTTSIPWDCDISYDLANPPALLSAQEWLNKHIAQARRDIHYHTIENQKEIDRTNTRNEWVATLRDSLDAPGT